MAKAIRRLKLKSLSEPIVRRPSLKDADIQNILNQRLNEVFKEFGIDGADPDRHRKLCLALLEQVLGIPGFQVLENDHREAVAFAAGRFPTSSCYVSSSTSSSAVPAASRSRLLSRQKRNSL